MSETEPAITGESPPALPTTLTEAIQRQKDGEVVAPPDGEPPLTEEQYEALRGTILAALERDCAENPYHTAAHTEEVEDRFLGLAAAARLNPAARQLGGLGALLHDYGHAGRTIRQETPATTDRTDLSNEEYAALKADELLKDSLTDAQITTVQVGILGTTFGQGPTSSHPREYRPLGKVDQLLAFADIAGFTKGFNGWMEESLQVFREMNAAALPATFEDMVKGRVGFLKYIGAKLAEVAPLIGPDQTAELQTQLAAVSTALETGGAEPYRATFEAIRASG